MALLHSRSEVKVVPAAPASSKLVNPEFIATGCVPLDIAFGCGGVPLGVITLLTGRHPAGRQVLAYRVLAMAQHVHVSYGSPLQKGGVAILNLHDHTDLEHLERCGVDREHLVFARAPSHLQAVDAIFDLARSRLHLLLVDGLPGLLRDHAAARYFDAALPQLQSILAAQSCAVIFLDEVNAPWRRWLKPCSSTIARCAALHVELQHEQWLSSGGRLMGYRVQARVLKSRWAPGGQTAPVEIIFKGDAPSINA